MKQLGRSLYLERSLTSHCGRLDAYTSGNTWVGFHERPEDFELVQSKETLQVATGFEEERSIASTVGEAKSKQATTFVVGQNSGRIQMANESGTSGQDPVHQESDQALDEGQIELEVWKHKETGKQYLATPWWEVLKKDELVAGDSQMLAIKDDHPDRKFKIGSLTQVGWLIKNDHGVWFGVSLDAKQSFEVVGTK